MFKNGYVGIIGRTNAGKSSLINNIIGEKVSIVTPKTQTTRDNILGIYNDKDCQIVFVDTPGIHKSRNYLDRTMMKKVRSAVASVDVIVYVVDASKRLITQEKDNILKYASEDIPVILCLSKIDLINKGNLAKFLLEFSNADNIKAIIPFSNKNGENISVIIDEIKKYLNVFDKKVLLFDEDLYTNSSVAFLTTEIIREKALLSLDQELPHGVKIEITKFDENDNKTTFIDCNLICEKEAHKSIILGKNGSKIKEIGSKARIDIENLLNKKVMLKIFVKVDKNWRQNKNSMV